MNKTALFLSLAILFGTVACDKPATRANTQNTVINTPQADTKQPENVVAAMKNYDHVYPFENGLAKVQKNEQYGLIDKNGKEVVAVQYDELYPFHEGLAFVKKGERVGFIDKTGKAVVPLQYDDDEEYYMELSHPPFFANGVVSLNKNGKAVLVDNTGKELNLKQYDESPYYWFSEGLAAVQKDGKWGFIDTTGKEVIAPQYDSADSFNNGLAQVEQNGQSVFIDKTGKAVFSVPQHYDYIYPFSDGLAKVEKGGKYGFMDKTGKEVIPVQYDSAYEFSEGLAFVKKEENGKWGVIDKTGREVVPMQYDTILRKFSDGLAIVEKDHKKDGYQYGFVDTTGREVVPVQYNFADDFSEGLASVYQYGKYGFIDTTGKKVIPFEYDLAHSFSEGLAAVEKDGKWQFIDKTGKTVIAVQGKIYQAAPAVKKAPPLPQRFKIDSNQYNAPLYMGEIAHKLSLDKSFDDFEVHKENLQEALKEAQADRRNINFAGQYMVVSAGCGTGCVNFYILDVKTGEVADSLYVSGYPVDKEGKLDPEEMATWVGWDIAHQQNSRLLFIEGDLGEDEYGFGGNGSFAFELKDGKLHFLQHSPVVQMSE